MATCPIKCELPNYFPLDFDLWWGKRGKTMVNGSKIWLFDLFWQSWANVENVEFDAVGHLSKWCQPMTTKCRNYSLRTFLRGSKAKSEMKIARYVFFLFGEMKAVSVNAACWKTKCRGCILQVLPASLPQSSCQGSGELRLGVKLKLVLKLSKDDWIR